MTAPYPAGPGLPRDPPSQWAVYHPEEDGGWDSGNSEELMLIQCKQPFGAQWDGTHTGPGT